MARGRWTGCVGVVVMLAASSPAAGQSRQVEVVTVNRAAIPADSVRRAQAETARLFATIGVEVIWTTGVQQHPRRLYIIIATEPAARESLSDGTLGVAISAPSQRGVLAYVFHHAVTAASRQHRTDDWSVLAIAMTHELGHLLLPANAHSKDGLMKARWTARDFIAASIGKLTFSDASAEQIRRAFGF